MCNSKLLNWSVKVDQDNKNVKLRVLFLDMILKGNFTLPFLTTHLEYMKGKK